MNIVGHPWTIAVYSTQNFERRMDNERAQIIVLTGLGISALLALLIWLLVSGRNRAIINERQQAFLLDFMERIREVVESEQIMDMASMMTGQYLKVGRVGYAEIDEARGLAIWKRDWTIDPFVSLAGESKPLYEFGGPLIAAYKRGETLCVHDVVSDPRTAGFPQHILPWWVRS